VRHAGGLWEGFEEEASVVAPGNAVSREIHFGRMDLGDETGDVPDVVLREIGYAVPLEPALDDPPEHGVREVGEGSGGEFGLFGVKVSCEGLEKIVVVCEELCGTSDGEDGVTLKNFAQRGKEGVPDAVSSERVGSV
jgi:hypothetical protein